MNRLAVLLCLLAAIPAADLRAQSARGTPAPVQIDHWVYDLLDRMAGSGVAAERWLPGRRPASAEGILAVLDHVAEADDSTWSETASQASEWIRAEQGLSDQSVLRVNPYLQLDLADRPDVDRRALGIGASMVWGPSSDLAFFADPLVEFAADGATLDLLRAGLAWRHRSLLFTASHDRPRFGRGAQGGVILGGEARLTGVSVALAEPTQLGGWLDWLGPVDGALGFNWIPESSFGPAGAFITNDIRIRPHPRVVLGLQRTLVVVSEIEGDPISWNEIGRDLLGRHTPYGDSKLSMVASLRATVAGLDLVPYLEWGIEDSAGLQDDPGVVLGVDLPAVIISGIPFGVGYEYVGIGDAGRALWREWGCCFERRNWYRSGSSRPEYVDDNGNLLGHSLGGYGHQHLLVMEGPLTERGTLLRAGAIVRNRESLERPFPELAVQENLLFPIFPGRSRGFFLDSAVRRAAAQLTFGVAAESGDEWRRVNVYVQVIIWR